MQSIHAYSQQIIRYTILYVTHRLETLSPPVWCAGDPRTPALEMFQICGVLDAIGYYKSNKISIKIVYKGGLWLADDAEAKLAVPSSVRR